MRAWILALAACGGEPAPPADPPQALVLTAPAEGARPPWQIQILTPADRVDSLTPEALFPRLATSLNAALSACDVGEADVPTFLLDGALRLDSVHGPTLTPRGTDPKVGCVAERFNAARPEGPPDVDVDLPVAMVLLGAPG